VSPGLPTPRIVLLAIAAGAHGLAVIGDGELLVGLSPWPLLAVPLALAAIDLAMHDWGMGRCLGGGGHCEGHGPD